MKNTRRVLAILLAATPAFFAATQAALPRAAHKHLLALVGTYTTKTPSKGIYAFDFDAETGKLTAKGVAAETPDPSWLVISGDGKHVYSVNEAGKQSKVSSFALDAASGKLTALNQLPSEGEDPCHLSFDKTGKTLLVANYTSGTVAAFPLLEDGKLGPHTSVQKDQGTLGPNKERQEGPHAHFIEADARNRFVFVADLGLDKVLIYEFDAAKGTLTPPAAPTAQGAPDPFSAKVSPGTGPRHFGFSQDGKYLYVLGEIKSTVTVFAIDKQQVYQPIQVISTLLPDFHGKNDAAEIALHPNGKTLYTSNRGDDTIATFRVDEATGKLTFVGVTPTGGKEPRHFAIDPTGHYLLAENQHSDSIVVFAIEQHDGGLARTTQMVSVPSPVNLQFYPAK
jgi:6-phosphogluconolactonase